MATLKVAKRSAALNACIQLHKIGELDFETLMPRHYGFVLFIQIKSYISIKKTSKMIKTILLRAFGYKPDNVNLPFSEFIGPTRQQKEPFVLLGTILIPQNVLVS